MDRTVNVFHVLCSKAFDVVSHAIIVYKLRKYRIKHTYYIVSYQEGSKKVVSFGSAITVVKSLLHGVPQGSVLGTLLFTIVINNLSLKYKLSCLQTKLY